VVLALAAAALAVYFAGDRSQEYGPEDSPQGVLRNYIIALERGDYQRAYGYLLLIGGEPDYDAFRRSLTVMRPDDRRSAAVQIGPVETLENGAARLELTITRGPYGPFDTPFRESAIAELRRSPTGAWQIVSLPYPYYDPSWSAPQPAP
jgi:hypothetical protein